MAKFSAVISWGGKANKVEVNDSRYPHPFTIPTLGEIEITIDAADSKEAIIKFDEIARSFNDRAQLVIESIR
ncbi:hypothetical protein ST201phi2-1p103 [Pseudomonas phage 201phi2-1]|uniref:Uncharacterized protein n=1 Tax=Pseudomonas phage 201phi2-1 TaxID=198110 RepID=B3FIW7_BP201|nr:hypothetical protein ST201phi2-1p103 [Pseudomonas phage 201phi2-1]ABY62936.1 hypothetical protein 201phi2-1p103 [Pseudomonas phage 201phi2-1]